MRSEAQTLLISGCPIFGAVSSRLSWAFAKRIVLFLALFLPLAAAAQLAPQPATVYIGVLSLFHPKTLVLTADHQISLRVKGSRHTLDPHQKVILRATAAGLTVDSAAFDTRPFAAEALTVTSEAFTLTVPGKLSRVYRGDLTVTAHNGILVPVVTMDTELAVASIVAAESPPHAPLEALKAQAIASRSFLIANPRTHPGFDACDTTHCQYLRSPPAYSSPAAVATRATRHVVLTWRASPESEPRIVAAMYSRSCGGQTRVPTAAGSDSYPFYSVRCDFCRRHPELWSRPANTPAPATEQDRIAWNRAHGWDAIPSNTHAATGTSLEGRGIGHGIGLCQLGAADLASHGESYSQILAHYFPNTALSTLP